MKKNIYSIITNKASLAAAFGALLVFTGCVTNVSDEVLVKHAEHTALGYNSLTVDAASSADKIVIQGSTTDTLSATATVTLWAKSADEAERVGRNMELKWSEGSNEAKLTTEYPGQGRELANISKLNVLAAKRLDLDIDVNSTDVAINGMSGHVKVDASSGDINVDTRGSIDLKTSSGDVTATTSQGGTIEASSGDVHVTLDSTTFDNLDINVSSGDVTVTIASGAGIDFDLETDSAGDISVSYDGFQLSDDSGELNFRTHGGGRRVKIITDSGSIRIRTLGN